MCCYHKALSLYGLYAVCKYGRTWLGFGEECFVESNHSGEEGIVDRQGAERDQDEKT